MILVIVEHARGKLSKSTCEMATAARQIGREGPVAMVVLGSGVSSVAEQAALLADHFVGALRPGHDRWTKTDR